MWLPFSKKRFLATVATCAAIVMIINQHAKKTARTLVIRNKKIKNVETKSVSHITEVVSTVQQKHTSLIQFYDLKQPLNDKNLTFECINTNYKPSIKICIYTDEEDEAISKQLREDGYWEQHVYIDIINALSKDKSLNFIDIGANIGVHSLYVAKLGRRVLALEPVYGNIIRLHKSAVINKVQDKITLLRNVVSDNRTRVDLMGNIHNRGGFSMSNDGQGYNIHNVQAILMDDLLNITNFTKAVMKIDIEGHEPNAIARGHKLFDKIDIPLICMEIGLLQKFYYRPLSNQYRDVQNMLDFLYSKGYIPMYKHSKLNLHGWGTWPWDVTFVK